MRPRAVDDVLKRAQIPFTTIHYPAAFSAQEQAAHSHVPGRSWAKTVVCHADNELILVVVPAHLRVDLGQLQTLLGCDGCRLATSQEFAELFPDCEAGATSPFATQRKTRIFVDQSFVGEPSMVFSAGTHSDAIQMHYFDFAEVMQPVVGRLTAAL